MKKGFLLITAALSALALSSCRVNWFGETAEAPWYVIALPIALVLVLSYIYLMRSYFVCPKCGAVFHPKWYDLSVGIHNMGQRYVKCPHCGRRGFCKRRGRNG